MERDTRIDGLKFLMIVFVVLGHMRFKDYGIEIVKMIYSFHMPVFVFLSGYLTSFPFKPEKHRHWIHKMLVIYAIAQVLHVLLGLLLGRSFDWGWLIKPEFSLWYLLCLVLWRLVVWFLYKGDRMVPFFLVSILLALCAGFVPLDHEFTFQRIFTFFPFFVAGFAFRKKELLPRLETLPLGLAVVLFAGGLFASRYLPLMMLKFHYLNLQDLFIRIIQISLGMVMCLSIVRLSRLPVFSKMAEFGEHTLWIYLGTSYLVRINPLENFLYGRFGLENNILEATCIALLYCLVFGWIAKWAHTKVFHSKTPSMFTL